jgi:glycosyltransferase involved in cell wall biosynthesis
VAKRSELRKLVDTMPANFHPELVRPYSGWIRIPVSLPMHLLRRPVDVLHVQNVGPLWSRAPIVATINDIAFERLPSTYPFTLRTRLRVAIRATARRAVLVTTSSRNSMNDLISLYGLTAEQVALVYPACPQRFSPRDRQAARDLVKARFGVPGPYLLHVGALEPKKNVEKLVAAFDQIAPDFPELRLLVCGPRAWSSAGTLRALEACRHRDRIVFAGYVSDEDLPHLYSGAALFVSLSAYEGFGFTPLEAMACGAPVLVANRGSLPETVGSGGAFVNPDDPRAVAQTIRGILESPMQAGALRERALRRAADFSLLAWARRLVEVYEETYERAHGRNQEFHKHSA